MKLILACLVLVFVSANADDTEYLNKVFDDLLDRVKTNPSLKSAFLDLDATLPAYSGQSPYPISGNILLQNVVVAGLDELVRQGNATGYRSKESVLLYGTIDVPASLISGNVNFQYTLNNGATQKANWQLSGLPEGDVYLSLQAIVNTRYNRVVVKSLTVQNQPTIDYDLSYPSQWQNVGVALLTDVENDLTNVPTNIALIVQDAIIGSH